MSFIKNKLGVSHQLGYMLTLSLTTVIIAVTLITTNSLIDQRAKNAGEIYAENIANKVASSVINVCVMKEQYPNANYSTLINLPQKLVDRFSYYIEIDNNAVHVKTNDGFIHEQSTIYNITTKNSLGLSTTKVTGGYGAINISCRFFDYKYKFDFGVNSSQKDKDFTKISNYSNNRFWKNNLNNWLYRTAIKISNPIGVDIDDYQILIQLNDSNFNYDLANSNGSDLRFIDSIGNSLDYWIERWHPRDTHTSRIWVELNLTTPESIIYMYYGNPLAHPVSDGEKTFIFFDDFSGNLNKWYQYKVDDGVSIVDGELKLINGSALNSITTIGNEPCVIETKAKTIGDAREASLFARNDESTPAPYDHSFLFASGNFSFAEKKNLSILKDNNLPPKDYSQNYVNSAWNRLVYIINGTDSVVARYFYENYTINGALTDSNSTASYQGSTHFGPCTTKTGVTAYYDWIFVRNYKADITASKIEDSIPISHLCGTESRNFEWEINDRVSSDRYYNGLIEYDYICNSSAGNPARFIIKNLTAGRYSFVFTVGHPNMIIDGMEIELVGISTKSIPLCQNKISSVLFRNIDVSGDLIIEFDDTSGNYFWAVGSLTIQKGDRVVNIRGGN